LERRRPIHKAHKLLVSKRRTARYLALRQVTRAIDNATRELCVTESCPSSRAFPLARGLGDDADVGWGGTRGGGAVVVDGGRGRVAWE
jgi:hypothetical protein